MNNKIEKSIYSLFVSQLYDDVVFKFKRNVLKKQMNIPWMRYREIELIKDLILNLKPKASLEWGAGSGTEFFTNYISEDCKWISVEHNQEWAESVSERNKKPNVSIVFKGPNHEPTPGIYYGLVDYRINDGTYEDFKDYIEYPSEHAPYDLILIDGRARTQCLTKSVDLLSKKGIVILHDANRVQYHEGFKHYQQGVLFTDQRESSGGIWIGTNSETPLSEVLDVDTYLRLWNLYFNFGKLIKV
ncbi:MAG: hypothetical protein RLN81_13730 [Balneolaceae bacterium]